jgi:uncharacterized membrane protein required for colicin V production
MSVLDLLLVLLMVASAARGYRLGFLVGAASTAGLLLGVVVGALAAPVLLERMQASLGVALAALTIVLLTALVGQAVGGVLGGMLRSAVTWQPARALDAVGGAALSVVAVLVIGWALGYVVGGTRIPWLSTQAQGSQVLSAVDRLMPDSAQDVLASLDDVVGAQSFPQYLGPFVQEVIEPVPAPDSDVLRDRDIRRASRSVVKVLGDASQCARGLEGSGFVYAPGRVMTNAHVVAGVSSVWVEGRRLPAEVVLYDDQLDVAVLSVTGLDEPPLTFDKTASAGDRAAVLGFPENGPFSDEAARIRSEEQLRSPDIYGDGSRLREVLAFRSTVRPGNSGGPLVSTGGEVYGLIFAASVADSSTGYALTAEQVADSATLGVAAAEPVSTGECV